MAKRVDQNQASIVAALRAVGCVIQDLHEVGRGCPDILVGYRGRNELLEIKTPSGTLNDNEAIWHQKWAGSVYVVRSAEEAVKIVTEA